MPNVKRSYACIPSWPMSAAKRPAKPISQPLTASVPATAPDIMHAEQREPEEFERAERERDLAERRRQEREADDAEERPGDRAGGGDAHRAAGLALARELVAVEARRGVRRSARDVEQDRRAAAAVDRADVGADQDQDGVVRRAS